MQEPHGLRLYGVPNGGADVEFIFSLFQQPRALPDLAEVVIGGHAADGEAHRDGLRVPGEQQLRLAVAAQHLRGLAQFALGGAVIDLHDLSAGHVAGVEDLHRGDDFAVRQRHLLLRQREAGVGKAVAEGIDHLFRRAGDGFKVAVADVDVLKILHIIVGVVEAVRAGIVAQVPREGVRQLAGGVALAQQQLRRREAAFKAALPGQQHRADSLIFLEPRGLDHAAGVQHHDGLRERGADLLQHGPLGVGQVEVPVLKNLVHHADVVAPLHALVLRGGVELGFAVPALAGEAADGDHRRVGEGPRRREKRVRDLRLVHQAGDVPCGVLRRDVVPVERGGAGKYRHLARGLNKALIEVADVGHGHVAAAAAALDIVDGALAEEGDSGALRQREDAALVFQQHHALLGGVFAQFNVLRAGCGALAVLPQRQGGEIIRSCPLVHRDTSFN